MKRSNEIIEIPIKKIVANPDQPRQIFDDEGIQELSDSIKAFGVLQPISVRQVGDAFELIMGERRLRASVLAEMDSVPAIVIDSDSTASAFMALIENLQRVDLNFVEEAEGFKRLIEQHNMSQKDVAAKVGKNQSTVSNKLRILKLSEKVRDRIIRSGLSERHARALLKLEDPNLQEKVLEQVIKNDLTVKKTEELVQTYLDLNEPKKKKNIRGVFNYRIYINTLKQAYQAIKDTGLNAEFDQSDKGDHIEVVVRIPKDKSN